MVAEAEAAIRELNAVAKPTRAARTAPPRTEHAQQTAEERPRWRALPFSLPAGAASPPPRALVVRISTVTADHYERACGGGCPTRIWRERDGQCAS